MRIIQFLNCDIKSIIEQLDNIKKQNFDTIQINPVQPFIDVEGYEWWATYQPLDFKIGNIYGTKDDLTLLCKEAKKRGLSVVVDVITNHLANDGAGRETIPHRNINKEIRDNEEYWKKHTKVNCFQTYKNIIEDSIGLPGLNLRNKKIQDIILNFLNELKDCGVSGFRFDAAKHIGLPSDGVSYFKRVKEFLEKNNLFAYAEFLDGPSHIQEILNEKKNEFADLMYVLTEENSEVNDSSKKVTFVSSHDTDLNEYGCTRNKRTEEIIDEYGELTKKFENTLFYVRDKKFGKKITDKNPDRMKYMDTSWINSEKIRKANLNSGKERKESKQMKNNDQLMNIQHNICMDMHDIMYSKLDIHSTINEIVNRVLEDYKAQLNINIMVDSMPFDKFLMNCVIGEFYKNDGNIKALNNISYRKFYILVLEALKDKLISKYSINDVEQQIETLQEEEKKEGYTRTLRKDEKPEESRGSIYGIG